VKLKSKFRNFIEIEIKNCFHNWNITGTGPPRRRPAIQPRYTL